MRLLIAMADTRRSARIRTLLYGRWESWQIRLCDSTVEMLEHLQDFRPDILLLQAGLPGMEESDALTMVARRHISCPPRVVWMAHPGQRSPAADCVIPLTASPENCSAIIETIAKKPLPILALADEQRLRQRIEALLNELSMPPSLKGRRYAAWLLLRLTPSPLGDAQPVGQWYQKCAAAHGTSAAAVERCLRLAVENVFTQGSIQGIERCFGEAVDPERGKPTNRAFLLDAARYLRRQGEDHSLALTRSLNKSEMHHKPAAPTSV